MATVVNQPAESNNNMGVLLAIIALIILAAIVFFYGLPYLQGTGGGTDVTVPNTSGGNVQPR